MSTKLGRRVTRLEGSAKPVEPLDIVVKFIEPGSMRVTGALKFRNGQWVSDEAESCPSRSTAESVESNNVA